jgi:organic radical activating enzyme
MTKIPVHETFVETVQGEGHWFGAPVDFIRLSGCPVACHFCDTGYSDGGQNAPRRMRDINDLIAEVRSPRVVVSGGEPFIQPHLPELVNALMAAGKHVHIETSGAFWQDIPGVWITVSPKQHVSPKYPVDYHMWMRANEVKIVISTGEEVDFYREFFPSAGGSIYLQPEWSDLAQTLPLTLELLKKNPSFFLSMQMHKLIGVQ